jgi:integrase
MPKKEKEISFPHVLKSRFGDVKVYKCKNGASWETFVVCWKSDGRRIRKSFSDAGTALARAEEVLQDLMQGRVERSETSTGKFIYYRACEEKLKGVPLMDAVDFYLSHFQARTNGITVADAVAQYISAKEGAAGNGDQQKRNLETMRYRLTPFAEAFQKPLASVTAREIDTYLNARNDWSGRTRWNHRSTLISLFRWAQDHKMLPYGERTAAQCSEEPKYEQKEPGIFSPDELEKLLNAADETILPYLALGALAGLRAAELGRLTWENVIWEESVIVLKKSVGKGGRRRAAIIRPELMSWLEEFKGRTGKILPKRRPDDTVAALAKRTGVRWVHNGMRHSYISYAMAIERNAAKVAEQCGNSESMVQRSYKAIVTERDARRWFTVKRSPVKF